MAASGFSKAWSRVLRVSDISRSGQPQHMLAEIVERHLLRDGRDLVESDLAPQALHVKLLGVAEAAEGLQRGVAGLKARLRGEQLGRVGLAAAGTPRVEEPRGLETHELRRVELGEGESERVGDRLVLTDG